MQINLLKALQELDSAPVTGTPKLSIPKGFINPGAWVVLASSARRNNVATSGISFSDPKVQHYSSAIGFNDCVYGEDDYEHNRKSIGSNYSPLTRLDCIESTDEANNQIVSCVRKMLANPESQGGVDLANVIGELHDNVWAHGRATGVSMAQKWSDCGRQAIEFALADTGHGFLRELKRYGKPAESDIQAVEWCVQKNNSTKHADDDDDDDEGPDDQVAAIMKRLGGVKL